MTLSPIPIRDAAGRKRKLVPLHEDEHLLVVDKPPGLAVLPDRWDPAIPNVRDLLIREYTRDHDSGEQVLWIVHRIDAETSGILLLARSAEMHRELNIRFSQADIDKRYLCLVGGRPPQESGRIELPLEQTGNSHRPVRPSRHGKPAISDYRIVEQFGQYTLLEVRPHSGRMHQIRVHMQHLGCPLAIDPLYGNKYPISINQLKRRVAASADGQPESALINRLTLHAAAIGFQDPFTQQQRRFEAPLPRDFEALLKALRKWDRLR